MKKLPFFIIVILLPATINFLAAQIQLQTTEFSFVLKSDSSAKSSLFSDIVETKSGYESPIIGIANWKDDNKQLQCRSLLAFNYGQLPNFFKQDQIVKAHLILVPLQIGATENTINNKLLQFSIKRVAEPWSDTVANWLNQPKADNANEVSQSIKVKKNDNYIKVDVTKIVKAMFRYGNNGFLFSYNSKVPPDSTFSNWFASAKYENEGLRPLLIITFSARAYPDFSMQEAIPPLPYTNRAIQQMLQNYIRPEPVMAPPVEVTGATPVKGNGANQ
jgi:hypothetical protein